MLELNTVSNPRTLALEVMISMVIVLMFVLMGKQNKQQTYDKQQEMMLNLLQNTRKSNKNGVFES